jgi:hypothetical protein
LPTGLSRIAPTFGNRFGQYIRLIYPTHSYQQDTSEHQCKQQFTGDTTMLTNAKIAVSFATTILFALVGLFAVAAIVMNVSAESRGIARSAPDLVCARFLC